MTQPKGRTALYRFFDRDDRLIYVGISNNPRARWEGHAADKLWWSSVVTREIEWFDTRKEAESAERWEISARSPKWNVAPGMPDPSLMVARQKPSKGWIPPDSLVELFARHEQEQEAVGKLRDELERAIVAEMFAGVSGNRLAKFFPWEPETFRRIAKKAGVPPLREPTVGKLRPGPPAGPASVPAAPPRGTTTRASVHAPPVGMTDLRARNLADLARTRATPGQLRKLDQTADSVGEGYRDYAVVSTAHAMRLLTDSELQDREA